MQRRGYFASRPMHVRQFNLVCAALAALICCCQWANAQAYPTRPITLIVPLPAGGASDTLARTLADHMKTTLGQPIVIENIAGAGGTIANTRLARAAPDGYTLEIGNWATHVSAGAIYPVQYDPLNDLEPVAFLADTPLWLVTKKDFPAKDFQELIAWLKANPDKASAAIVGIGSGGHLCGLFVQKMTGTQFQFVPYRGGAPAMQDLASGQTDFMCDMAANSLPQARAGNIKPIVVMARKRWFATPDVPTADEMGVPGIYISLWHGLWAPRGTPKDVIARVNAAIVLALADPQVRERMTQQGHEIPAVHQQSAEALRTLQRAEADKWWPIIKAQNIRAE